MIALEMPKLAMNEAITVVEASLNSSEPISGTTVRSSPTMPPTKAFTRSSSANCRQFSLSPSCIGEWPAPAAVRTSGMLRPLLRWPHAARSRRRTYAPVAAMPRPSPCPCLVVRPA